MSAALRQGLTRRASTSISVRATVGWAIGASALAAVFAILHVCGVDVPTLTRDPTATAGVGPQVGVLSTLGLTLWAATAAILGLAGTVVGPGIEAAYLAVTAAGVGALLVDDALLLHEQVLPDAGIPQDLTYAVYLAAALAWLVAFRREIASGCVTLLVLAAASFATSIALDVLDVRQGVEDYAKEVGIATLLGWAWLDVRRRLAPAPVPPPAWLESRGQRHSRAHPPDAGRASVQPGARGAATRR